MDDRTHQNNGAGAGKMIGILALGAVAGAIAGVLLAPKSGEETRADLAELAEKMKNDIGEKLSTLSEVTVDTYNQVVGTVVGKYESTKEITSDEAGKLKDELGKNFEEVKKSLKESATNTKDRLDNA